MMLRFFSLWGPVVGWCGLIFYLSGIPDLGTGLGQWDLLLRKLAHIGEYAVLAGLLWRAFGGSGIRRPPLLFWTSFLAAAVYAVSDEYHQSFVPGRFGSSLDVFLDSAGALLAASLLRWRHRRAVPPAGMLIALLVFSTGCSRVRRRGTARKERPVRTGPSGVSALGGEIAGT
jgi:VanZ family protein